MLRNAFFTGSKALSTALVGIYWENLSSRRIHRWQLDILSIPNDVIKKGRPHGNRHGKTEEQRQHFIAHDLRKRSITKLKEFTVASRKISDFVTRNSELIELILHPDHLWYVVRRVYEIWKELVDFSQHTWTQCTDETPIRLRRSINKIAPSSPWVWRRATCTDFFLEVSEMASVVFFIQQIMVAVERFLVELIKFIIKVMHLWAREMSGVIERGDMLSGFYAMLFRSDILQVFSICCSQIVYSW